MTTLFFGNGQLFIEKGKRYNDETFQFAKIAASSGSRISFTHIEGSEIKLSPEKGSKFDYRKVFKVIK